MKIVVVVGGVISGVGKGIATAAIGKILQQYGFSTTAVKIDPYINYDAGTLRPTEHGEVWVTDDGGEIDQDLGNYERFLGFDIPKRNNMTTGQIYKELIDRERRGEFLGQTVEVIPEVPNEIKRRIREASEIKDAEGRLTGQYDFVLVEVGGTIGDYQNMPYLFATKSLEIEMGWENVAHILVTYLPVPDNIGEMKTKPTQQAIKMLNETGIFPDFVLCRANKPLDDVRKQKIQQNANVDADHIISAPDIKTIYRVPLNFEAENLGQKILKRMKVQPKKIPDWTNWKSLAERIENPGTTIKVAMVGKYIDIGSFSLTDSYISVNEALKHAGANNGAGIEIEWIDSKQFERDPGTLNKLKNYHGIIVPGGFGGSGVEGKIKAIEFARLNNVPFLGLCYGLQLAVVEYARNVCNLADAHTTEINKSTMHPVIDIIPTQKEILEKGQYGGTMRLGAYSAILKDGTNVLDLYKRAGRMNRDKAKIETLRENEAFRLGVLDGSNVILERHRHRYEVNPKFIDILERSGFVFSGFHHRLDGTKLMEFGELPKHKFFVGTQAHPEFKSRLEDPSPLFFGFVEACLKTALNT
ncbi:MAG: CTP synthase [Candidatus Aenigmarchaeota archaeon]|nr:CTP synthase [Candidatus Aenigmarchaeota archaeon]